MDDRELAIITINKDGRDLAKKLKVYFKNARVFNERMERSGSLRKRVETVFNEYTGLIFIAALGIVVRIIGPLAKSKLSDPAVVEIDSAGRFAISVLSGHEGGANNLAFLAAACLDAIPVITTASQAHKRFIVGIGARKGVEAAQVRRALKYVLKKNRIRAEDVRVAATLEIKKNEPGLLRACAAMRLPLVFISKESIKYFKAGISESEVVKRHLGLNGVCEPCALLAGRRTKLIANKEIRGAVTVAIAKEN